MENRSPQPPKETSFYQSEESSRLHLFGDSLSRWWNEHFGGWNTDTSEDDENEEQQNTPKRRKRKAGKYFGSRIMGRFFGALREDERQTEANSDQRERVTDHGSLRGKSLERVNLAAALDVEVSVAEQSSTTAESTHDVTHQQTEEGVYEPSRAEQAEFTEIAADQTPRSQLGVELSHLGDRKQGNLPSREDLVTTDASHTMRTAPEARPQNYIGATESTESTQQSIEQQQLKETKSKEFIYQHPSEHANSLQTEVTPIGSIIDKQLREHREKLLRNQLKQTQQQLKRNTQLQEQSSHQMIEQQSVFESVQSTIEQSKAKVVERREHHTSPPHVMTAPKPSFAPEQQVPRPASVAEIVTPGPARPEVPTPEPIRFRESAGSVESANPEAAAVPSQITETTMLREVLPESYYERRHEVKDDPMPQPVSQFVDIASQNRNRTTSTAKPSWDSPKAHSNTDFINPARSDNRTKAHVSYKHAVLSGMTTALVVIAIIITMIITTGVL